MDVIVPCAGLSSRFPNLKPKYLLEDNDGKLMIENVISKMFGKNNIYISLLKEHVDKYDSYNIIKKKFDKFIEIVVIDNLTKGPAETVVLTLEKIKNDGPFLVRDCDSFFDFKFNNNGNFVFTSKLSNNKLIKNPEQLGYVVKNKNSIIASIVEKKIVSDDFCVGGYQFNRKTSFINNFKMVVDNNKEIFVSHVISSMIKNLEIFHIQEVINYINVGTVDNWNLFTSNKNIMA